MTARKSHYELTGRIEGKIDVYRKLAPGLDYLGSTNWHRTCKEAVAAFAAHHNLPVDALTARHVKRRTA